MRKSNLNLIQLKNRSIDESTVCISVIVNVFNHEKYLTEALDSILSQKVNFSVEILVHDDCSIDKSAKIIKEYEKKYPTIIKPIFEMENQFSKGIEIDAAYNYPRVRGKYVAMLEGDDKWIDDMKLFKQFMYLEKHKNVSACIAKTVRWNMRDNSCGFYGLANGKRNKLYSLKDLIKGKDFSVSSLLARREFFVPPFPDFINFFAGFTDIQLGFYFALKNKIYYNHKPMSLYRQYSSPTSFTSSFSALPENRKLKIYENRITVLELLRKECPEKYRNVLEKRIKQEKFNLLSIKNDLDALKSDEYIHLYKRKMRHKRIKQLLRIK